MHTSRDELRPTFAGDYAAKSIDALPTIYEGFGKLVRAGLGITAFGANIMDLPPDYSTSAHDESDTGQQTRLFRFDPLPLQAVTWCVLAAIGCVAWFEILKRTKVGRT